MKVPLSLWLLSRQSNNHDTLHGQNVNSLETNTLYMNVQLAARSLRVQYTGDDLLLYTCFFPTPSTTTITTHHINQLSDGEAKVHQHHVSGVGHRPRELVVASEECLQQSLLSMGSGRSPRHCRSERPKRDEI